MTTLTDLLKQQSHEVHDSVDHLVMSMKPFESHDNYKKFLQAQHAFHTAVLPIYQNSEIAKHFDDLPSLSRLSRVEADMQDLATQPFANLPAVPAFDDTEALGWLYCVEGSNVGAAILYKEAGKIELNDTHGASHLAAHPDGRMPHWRAVKAQIDAIALSDDERAKAVKGCHDAFAYFKAVMTAIHA